MGRDLSGGRLPSGHACGVNYDNYFRGMSRGRARICESSPFFDRRQSNATVEAPKQPPRLALHSKCEAGRFVSERLFWCDYAEMLVALKTEVDLPTYEPVTVTAVPFTRETEVPFVNFVDDE